MKWRFEYIFAFVVTVILSGALFGAFWINNGELINMILTAFVGALSAITTYFFTKHNPNKSDDE